MHSSARPPNEQSVHDHWKSSVRQSFSQRKGHFNAIEKVENSHGSIQRFLNLREISFKHEGMSLSSYFEACQFPLCFFTKEIPIQLAVEKFVSLCRSLHVVEDCLLDSLEENLLKQGTQEELDNEDRLCVATVICQDEQSLKVGGFVKGSYGWVVSTSDRLQCYAYTPCTLLFMVPAGCRVNEACAPTSHLHLKQIFPLSKYQEQDCTMKNNDPDKVELSQATPLGFNPTKSPADSPGTPVGETSNKSDDTKDDSTKIVSPTQVWSEGMPVTRDKAKTTPSYRRACVIILLGPNERLTSTGLFTCHLVMTCQAEQQPQVGLQLYGLN